MYVVERKTSMRGQLPLSPGELGDGNAEIAAFRAAGTLGRADCLPGRTSKLLPELPGRISALRTPESQ